MAETTKLKAIQLGEYRWVFLTRGIILLVFGLWGIIWWWIISLAGTKMLGIYVSMIFISEGLMTMAVSIFIRKLKYWWVTLIAGSVSLLSAAIILMAGERSEIVTFVIGGWCILKALFALCEHGIFKNKDKKVWLLDVKNVSLILLAPLVMLSLTYGPGHIALCVGYYFVIHGSNQIILSFFGLKNREPHQSGGSP
jgi:uncharacterized membrane protein HdeD (DUF308 family)